MATIVRKAMKKKSIVARWRDLKVLVIDEISMLDVTVFEALDQMAKLVRGSDLPFGGVQLIVVGDFLQLPPVSTPNLGLAQPLSVPVGSQIDLAVLRAQRRESVKRLFCFQCCVLLIDTYLVILYKHVYHVYLCTFVFFHFFNKPLIFPLLFFYLLLEDF